MDVKPRDGDLVKQQVSRAASQGPVITIMIVRSFTKSCHAPLKATFEGARVCPQVIQQIVCVANHAQHLFSSNPSSWMVGAG